MHKGVFMDLLINILGWVAAGLTTLSSVPQAFKSIKSRNTEGISLLMYILFTLGVIIWAIYGILSKNWIVFSANAITLVFSLIVLIIKLINVIKGKETAGIGHKETEKEKIS